MLELGLTKLIELDWLADM